jgi:hypothetical protein
MKEPMLTTTKKINWFAKFVLWLTGANLRLARAEEHVKSLDRACKVLNSELTELVMHPDSYTSQNIKARVRINCEIEKQLWDGNFKKD